MLRLKVISYFLVCPEKVLPSPSGKDRGELGVGLGWNTLKHFPKIVTVVEMYGEGAASALNNRAGLDF